MEGSEHKNAMKWSDKKYKYAAIIPFMVLRRETGKEEKVGSSVVRPSDLHLLAPHCEEQDRKNNKKSAKEERKIRKKVLEGKTQPDPRIISEKARGMNVSCQSNKQS